jgi:hypothetical protein
LRRAYALLGLVQAICLFANSSITWPGSEGTSLAAVLKDTDAFLRDMSLRIAAAFATTLPKAPSVVAALKEERDLIAAKSACSPAPSLRSQRSTIILASFCRLFGQSTT